MYSTLDPVAVHTISVLPATPITLLQKKVAKLLRFPPAAHVDVALYTVKSPPIQEGFDSHGANRNTQTLEATSETPAACSEKATLVHGETVGWWFTDGDGVLVEV